MNLFVQYAFWQMTVTNINHEQNSDRFYYDFTKITPVEGTTKAKATNISVIEKPQPACRARMRKYGRERNCRVQKSKLEVVDFSRLAPKASSGIHWLREI